MEEEILPELPELSESNSEKKEAVDFTEAEVAEGEGSALIVSYTDAEAEEFMPAIEAIFFTADHPVSIERLKEVFGESSPTEEQLSKCVEKLREKFREHGFGFEIREAQGGFHFVTKVENSEYIRRFLATKPFRLGRSSLETLAIIAYRQPITRAEIDKVRGIDSSHLLRTLMERDLVKMAGKADVPGRPVQYSTTPRFLEILGLKSLGELPPLTELDQLQGHTEDPEKLVEAGLDKFMKEKMTPEETGEDTQGLSEIESLIDSVQKTPKEVYESPLHAEVAAENEAALEAFLSFMKPFRRRTHVENADETLTTDDSTPETPIVN
jgi:segregation and condensation protein B